MGFRVDELFADFSVEFGSLDADARKVEASLGKMSRAAGVADQCDTAQLEEADVELRGMTEEARQCLTGCCHQLRNAMDALNRVVRGGVDRLPAIEAQLRAKAVEKGVIA